MMDQKVLSSQSYIFGRCMNVHNQMKRTISKSKADKSKEIETYKQGKLRRSVTMQ